MCVITVNGMYGRNAASWENRWAGFGARESTALSTIDRLDTIQIGKELICRETERKQRKEEHSHDSDESGQRSLESQYWIAINLNEASKY